MSVALQASHFSPKYANTTYKVVRTIFVCLTYGPIIKILTSHSMPYKQYNTYSKEESSIFV